MARERNSSPEPDTLSLPHTLTYLLVEEVACSCCVIFAPNLEGMFCRGLLLFWLQILLQPCLHVCLYIIPFCAICFAGNRAKANSRQDQSMPLQHLLLLDRELERNERYHCQILNHLSIWGQLDNFAIPSFRNKSSIQVRRTPPVTRTRARSIPEAVFHDVQSKHTVLRFLCN